MNPEVVPTKVSISAGNMKLGAIPNISLPPIKSCAKGIACYKVCYALKSFRMYPNVRAAWENNWKLWWHNKILFENLLYDWLYRNKPQYFRYHVGGDIPSDRYFEMILRLAWSLPYTKFLVYTKRLDRIRVVWNRESRRPPNVTVYLSRWPNDSFGEGFGGLPNAWYLDPATPDPRIPGDAFHCPGSCETCKHCYESKQDVVFTKH